MKQPAFAELAVPDRVEMAPASLENWSRILPRLKEDQYAVLMAIYRYREENRADDVTGKELADWFGLNLLDVRPRMTELRKLKLIERGPSRPSRVGGEASSHPVRPTLPKSAAERWRANR